MERKIIELGCPSDKIIYNPCGPNDTLFNLNPHFKSNNIISIGRFVDKKAPFKEVVNEIPDAQLTMIGNGPLWEACQNIAKFLNLENNVKFLGFTEHNKINNYLESSSLYIQSSITSITGDQEGTPVSIMEASLAGLPIVSTKHAGISDVIINNKTGILLEEHDVKGLSKAIIYLLKNKKEAIRMGNAGKKYINDNFKLSISLNKIEQYLK